MKVQQLKRSSIHSSNSITSLSCSERQFGQTSVQGEHSVHGYGTHQHTRTSNNFHFELDFRKILITIPAALSAIFSMSCVFYNICFIQPNSIYFTLAKCLCQQYGKRKTCIYIYTHFCNVNSRSISKINFLYKMSLYL